MKKHNFGDASLKTKELGAKDAARLDAVACSKLGFYNCNYLNEVTGRVIVREARVPGSLQPQSAREWQPDDVAPVGRGHERPSLSLVISVRCRAARATGAASESPVSDSAPPAIDGDACRGK